VRPDLQIPVFPGQGTREAGTETAPLVNTTRSAAMPKIAERPAQRSGILVSQRNRTGGPVTALFVVTTIIGLSAVASTLVIDLGDGPG
jgi:hypothetical protein